MTEPPYTGDRAVQLVDAAGRIQRLEAELAAAKQRIAELEGAAIIEYGQLYSGGGHLTWLIGAEIERIHPLADRIASGQRFGGKVGRCRIIVLEDWKNLRKGAKW